MEITTMNREHLTGVAEILAEAFPWCYGGEKALPEAESFLEPQRVAFVAIEDGTVVGIIGGEPHYGVTGWELHPLAVRETHRNRDIGTQLVRTLERELALRGGITLFLGSDDEFGTTSLYGVDLYDDTFGKIERIENRGHPFPFYEKHGFKIVGVFPDVNGYGKPDIWMAKRISL